MMRERLVHKLAVDFGGYLSNAIMADDFPFPEGNPEKLRTFENILLNCFTGKDKWDIAHNPRLFDAQETT